MEEIIHDRVTRDGMCEVKLVSDQPLTEARMLRFVSGASSTLRSAQHDHVKVNCYDTAALSLFYGEIVFPLRGAIEIMCEGWPKMRRLAAWRLMPEDGLRVSQVIERLAEWYFVQTHQRAGFAFMKKLPNGVENAEYLGGGDLMLFQADWALDKCVMVGG